MSNPTLSVIIATYNRAGLLEETLKSILRADFSGIAYEIIVVDNNSSDATLDVAARLAERHPSIRVVRESAQGLSHARNAGVRVATGDVIAFLDDDVEVDSKWPNAIVGGFRESNVWCVTGKVLAHGGVSAPEWLPKRLLFLISLADLGDEARALRGQEKPLGCNMAFRRFVFEKVGGFDISLGRRGHMLLGGEEVMLFHRMRAAGGTAYYVPNALVHHKIAPKTQREYVIEYAFWLGASESYIERRMMPVRWIAKSARAVFRIISEPLGGVFPRGGVETIERDVERAFLSRYHRGYIATPSKMALKGSWRKDTGR